MRPLRRAAQFFQALAPGFSVADQRMAADHLTEKELALFHGMSTQDRRHGVRVLRALLEDGEADPDLLKAGLLHDVGKTDPAQGVRIPLFCRVFVVLAEAVYPPLIGVLARENAGVWRHSLYLHRWHPERGAALAHQAGCSGTVVRLIREHRAPHGDPLGRRLKAADERS